MAALIYRLTQFWWSFTARPLTPAEVDLVQAILPPLQWQLFQQFSYSDQNHSLRVLGLLQDAQHSNSSLLAAALLHDIGKTQVELSIFERSFIVLGRFLSPNLTSLWGQLEWEKARSWQRPFVLKAQHAKWGADMLAEIDADPLLVWLVEHHQDSIESFNPHSDSGKLLSVLQWADDQC